MIKVYMSIKLRCAIAKFDTMLWGLMRRAFTLFINAFLHPPQTKVKGNYPFFCFMFSSYSWPLELQQSLWVCTSFGKRDLAVKCFVALADCAKSTIPVNGMPLSLCRSANHSFYSFFLEQPTTPCTMHIYIHLIFIYLLRIGALREKAFYHDWVRRV